jgi:transposase
MIAASLPASRTIQSSAVAHDHGVLVAYGTADRAVCPDCGMASDRVQGRYQRHPLDQPWRGWTVRGRLTVRRCVCANSACARTTVAEACGPRLPRRAQRLASWTDLLYAMVYTVGGEAGARLARLSGVPISPDTLLRLLAAAPLEDTPTPRILGVDDFAWRKGRRYGTIRLDLETQRPVDLLPNREAETVAAWLRQQPGVAVIARDRAEAYARGARDGAPQARQIADRFHLVKNASSALDELLAVQRRGRALQNDSVLSSNAPEASPLPDLRGPSRSAARSTARLARWKRVQDLHGRGVSISHIARETELDRKTVRRLVATPEPSLPQSGTIARPGGLTSPLLQPYVA